MSTPLLPDVVPKTDANPVIFTGVEDLELDSQVAS